MESFFRDMIKKETHIMIEKHLSEHSENRKREREYEQAKIMSMEKTLKRYKKTISKMQKELDNTYKMANKSKKILDKFTASLLLNNDDEDDEDEQGNDNTDVSSTLNDGGRTEDEENIPPTNQNTQNTKNVTVIINKKKYEVARNSAGRNRACFHASDCRWKKKPSERFVPMLSDNGTIFGRRVCSRIHNDGFHCHWRFPGGEWQEGKTPSVSKFTIVEI